MRTMTALLLAASAAIAGDTREDVARKLEMKVSLDLKRTPLVQAIDLLREATGMNFLVAEGARTPVTLTVRDISAKSALRLMLVPAGLGAVYEGGAVVIRRSQSIASPVALRIYDVRAASLKLQEFPGPRLQLGPWRVFG